MFPDDRRAIADPITTEILSRLEFLAQVGLDYLTLDRPAATFSGGELQRVRLASGLGSGLVGVATCSTSPRSACIRATTIASFDALESLQTAATR